MNNNPSGYFDDAMMMQMNSAQQIHPRFSNNEQNQQSNPYIGNQLNNVPPVGVGNLGYPQPANNPYMQQNPQPTNVQQSRIGYPPAYNNINPPPYYNGPPIYQPPPQSNPVYVINVGGNSAPVCNLCHKSASSINRKRCGCAVITWCVCLLLFTGCLCWIPFVMDECYDH